MILTRGLRGLRGPDGAEGAEPQHVLLAKDICDLLVKVTEVGRPVQHDPEKAGNAVVLHGIRHMTALASAALYQSGIVPLDLAEEPVDGALCRSSPSASISSRCVLQCLATVWGVMVFL